MILLRYKVPGKAWRVCNAQCYDAKTKGCKCICGGINHGQGEQTARRNGRIWFQEFAGGNPALEIVRHQGNLFDGDESSEADTHSDTSV